MADPAMQNGGPFPPAKPSVTPMKLKSAFLGLLAAFSVHAQQDYPNRPIRLVVPAAPGGVTDLLARRAASYLDTAIGQRIVVEHRAYDWGIFFADVKSGNTELYTLSWPGISDPHLYFELFHSSNIGNYNRTRYRNAEMDRLTDLGDSVLEPEKRRPYYFQIQELAARDLPFISLWHPKNTAVFRKNIKGVSVHPLGIWRVILAMRKEPG